MLSEISISYDKTINTNENNTQKELIMQTKYETAEKMMKNYELKYLTAERDKNTLTKNYNDLQNKFNLLHILPSYYSPKSNKSPPSAAFTPSCWALRHSTPSYSNSSTVHAGET
jgi:hypothetical protein